MSFFRKESPSGHPISRQTADDFLRKAKFVQNQSENEIKIKINEGRSRLRDKLEEVDKLLASFPDILPKGREMQYMLQITAAKKLLEQDELSVEKLNDTIQFVEMILEEIKGKI